MNLRTVGALGLASLLTGCAAPKELRNDTRTVGLYVQTVKNDAEEFARLRDAATKARMANIAALELKTLRAEQAIQRDVHVLEIIQDKERMQLLAALRNASDLIVAQRKEYEARSAGAKSDVEKAKSALNFRISKLSETSATLLKLADDRTLREDIQFYSGFLKQVRDHVKTSLKDDAEKASKHVEDSVTKKQKANAKGD